MKKFQKLDSGIKKIRTSLYEAYDKIIEDENIKNEYKKGNLTIKAIIKDTNTKAVLPKIEFVYDDTIDRNDTALTEEEKSNLNMSRKMLIPTVVIDFGIGERIKEEEAEEIRKAFGKEVRDEKIYGTIIKKFYNLKNDKWVEDKKDEFNKMFAEEALITQILEGSEKDKTALQNKYYTDGVFLWETYFTDNSERVIDVRAERLLTVLFEKEVCREIFSNITEFYELDLKKLINTKTKLYASLQELVASITTSTLPDLEVKGSYSYKYMDLSLAVDMAVLGKNTNNKQASKNITCTIDISVLGESVIKNNGANITCSIDIPMDSQADANSESSVDRFMPETLWEFSEIFKGFFIRKESDIDDMVSKVEKTLKKSKGMPS